MHKGLLPLFPLEVVLLPGTALPLHIFEERYKEMIGEVLAQSSEFGVVLAQRNGILRVGCTATIEEVVRRYDDGRMDILTVGRRRFQILGVDSEKSYLRGEVDFFEDEDTRRAPIELRRQAIVDHQRLVRLKQEEPDGNDEPSVEDPDLSFQLAQVSPDLNFRQMMLTLRSEVERLEHVARHLRELLERYSLQTEMRKVAQTNGHGRHGKMDLSGLT